MISFYQFQADIRVIRRNGFNKKKKNQIITG